MRARVPPIGGVERALRTWGLVVGIAYGALSLGVIVILATNEPEDALVGTAIVGLLLVVSGAFIWGQITWNTRRSWIVRSAAWFALVVGAIPLNQYLLHPNTPAHFSTT